MKKIAVNTALGLAAFGLTLSSLCVATGHCQSAAASPVEVEKKAPAKSIHWEKSLADALAQSKQTGKPVFVDFYATWCGPCRMLEEQTYPHEKVIAASQGWHMVKIDTDQETAIAAKYGIRSLPTLGVLRSDGKPVYGTVGFLEPDEMVSFLREGKKRAAK